MNPHPHPAVAVVLAAILCCDVSVAQTTTAPVSRAEVKATTRAAEKAGQLTPAGQGPRFAVPRTTEKTRAQRKAETIAARHGGTLMAAGDAREQKIDRDIRSRPTTVDRAARKAETRAAERAGTLTPAGEGSPKPGRQ